MLKNGAAHEDQDVPPSIDAASLLLGCCCFLQEQAVSLLWSTHWFHEQDTPGFPKQVEGGLSNFSSKTFWKILQDIMSSWGNRDQVMVLIYLKALPQFQ